MFHPAVIAHRQEQLEREFKTELPPGGLQRYPIADVRYMRSRIELSRDEKGRQIRDLTRDEQAFCTNEWLLSKIDFAYWAERYATISVAASAVGPMYPLWGSQTLMLERLGQVEYAHWKAGDPDGVLVNILKARQLGACLEPSTRVLTADLRWVPIDDIKPGQELVAVDETIPGGKGAARKMRTAVVGARRDVFAEAFRIVLEGGDILVATANHRLLYRTRTQTQATWREVGAMRPGGHLRYATRPWESPSVEDGWMAGMLDGEGSGGAKKAGGAEVCISQVYGPVYDRLTAYFTDRHYSSFHEEVADRRVPGTSSKFGRRPVGKVSIARMDEIFRLIGQTRPTRFIGRRWWEGKELPGKRNGTGWSRILAIRPVGMQRMVDLQTSTGTFIAEGIVSHNSTLTEAIVAHHTTTHGSIIALVASDEPESSAKMFRMFVRVVDNLPWYLKPEVTDDVKNTELAFDTGSRVEVGAGKSTRGTEGQRGQIGRSGTYSVVHLSELTTWENPKQIDGALIPAIPSSPRVFVVCESTAKGRLNWWHKHWLATKKGTTRFANVFIPWYAEVSKYWRPAPVDWTPSAQTLAHARRCEETSHQWMGHTVRLRREQLYWYETTRAGYLEKDDLSTFLEEFCSDDEECFQHAGRSIFPLAVRERIRTDARSLVGVLEIKPRREIESTA